jgi:hypothetical protein
MAEQGARYSGVAQEPQLRVSSLIELLGIHIGGSCLLSGYFRVVATVL